LTEIIDNIQWTDEQTVVVSAGLSSLIQTRSVERRSDVGPWNQRKSSRRRCRRPHWSSHCMATTHSGLHVISRVFELFASHTDDL